MVTRLADILGAVVLLTDENTWREGGRGREGRELKVRGWGRIKEIQIDQPEEVGVRQRERKRKRERGGGRQND